jgi:hypothetical protein
MRDLETFAADAIQHLLGFAELCVQRAPSVEVVIDGHKQDDGRHLQKTTCKAVSNTHTHTHAHKQASKQTNKRALWERG